MIINYLIKQQVDEYIGLNPDKIINQYKNKYQKNNII